METWIIENLPLTADGQSVLLEEYSNGATMRVSITDLLVLLSSIKSPPTYVELSSLPIASQGWQKYFDQWKAQGIIA